jgi:short-subunit dehydrogenase
MGERPMYYGHSFRSRQDAQEFHMKIVIVTGSSRGLGASTAIKCAERGMGAIVTFNRNSE